MQDLERSRNTRHRPAVEVFAGAALMLTIVAGLFIIFRALGVG